MIRIDFVRARIGLPVRRAARVTEAPAWGENTVKGWLTYPRWVAAVSVLGVYPLSRRVAEARRRSLDRAILERARYYWFG